MAYNDPMQSEYLLRLITEDVRKNLTAQLERDLLNEFRPKINEAVEAAMSALKPQIEKHADQYGQTIVFRLSVNKVDKE